MIIVLETTQKSTELCYGCSIGEISYLPPQAILVFTVRNSTRSQSEVVLFLSAQIPYYCVKVLAEN